MAPTKLMIKAIVAKVALLFFSNDSFSNFFVA